MEDVLECINNNFKAIPITRDFTIFQDMKSNNHLDNHELGCSNFEERSYVTPPAHIDFKALKLWNEECVFSDLSIAHIMPGGGGPSELHTHLHDHLFVVVEGEATILEEDKVIILRKDEAYRVKGSIPHSVWNRTQNEVTMLGITLLP